MFVQGGSDPDEWPNRTANPNMSQMHCTNGKFPLIHRPI